MDSINDVLNAAKQYCREHTSEATYQYYISDIKAVSFENSNCITLEVRNDFICKIVSDRYTGLLKDAFKAVLGFDVEVKFTVPQPEPEAAKEKRPMDEASLPSGRYDFTFENFIRGPSNQFAFAAAQAVAANPSGAYNPLFIYGGVGLGKTHLMHAIGNRLLQDNPNARIKYVSSEAFANDFINSIKSKNSEAFRQKYRNLDLLLVDDIQFFAEKDGTQEEFFHTFNALHSAGKQIILTSDKPPKDMETLEERIRSRFEWGLMADIGAPDYETRMAILRRKVESDDMSLSDDILNYIANNIKSNIRELEGALNKLLAYSNLEKTEITMEIAKKELQNIITPDKPREITPQLIIEVVSEHFQISLDQMISKNRSNEIARPRQIAMYLCKTMTDIPLDSIGSLLGGRDHSTIIHGIKKIADEYDSNEQTRNLIETIKKKINPN